MGTLTLPTQKLSIEIPQDLPYTPVSQENQTAQQILITRLFFAIIEHIVNFLILCRDLGLLPVRLVSQDTYNNLTNRTTIDPPGQPRRTSPPIETPQPPLTAEVKTPQPLANAQVETPRHLTTPQVEPEQIDPTPFVETPQEEESIIETQTETTPSSQTPQIIETKKTNKQLHVSFHEPIAEYLDAQPANSSTWKDTITYSLKTVTNIAIPTTLYATLAYFMLSVRLSPAQPTQEDTTTDQQLPSSFPNEPEGNIPDVDTVDVLDVQEGTLFTHLPDLLSQQSPVATEMPVTDPSQNAGQAIVESFTGIVTQFTDAVTEQANNLSLFSTDQDNPAVEASSESSDFMTPLLIGGTAFITLIGIIYGLRKYYLYANSSAPQATPLPTAQSSQRGSSKKQPPQQDSQDIKQSSPVAESSSIPQAKQPSSEEEEGTPVNSSKNPNSFAPLDEIPDDFDQYATAQPKQNSVVKKPKGSQEKPDNTQNKSESPSKTGSSQKKKKNKKAKKVPATVNPQLTGTADKKKDQEETSRNPLPKISSSALENNGAVRLPKGGHINIVGHFSGQTSAKSEPAQPAVPANEEKPQLQPKPKPTTTNIGRALPQIPNQQHQNVSPTKGLKRKDAVNPDSPSQPKKNEKPHKPLEKKTSSSEIPMATGYPPAGPPRAQPYLNTGSSEGSKPPEAPVHFSKLSKEELTKVHSHASAVPTSSSQSTATKPTASQLKDATGKLKPILPTPETIKSPKKGSTVGDDWWEQSDEEDKAQQNKLAEFLQRNLPKSDKFGLMTLKKAQRTQHSKLTEGHSPFKDDFGHLEDRVASGAIPGPKKNERKAPVPEKTPVDMSPTTTPSSISLEEVLSQKKVQERMGWAAQNSKQTLAQQLDLSTNSTDSFDEE